MAHSQALAEEIRRDMLKEGVITEVNIQPFPADELVLSDNGWGDKDDTFFWLMRLALPKDPEEYQEYVRMAEN